MCATNKCGCSSSSDSSGVLAVIGAFFVGLYLLVRYVVGPVALVAAVLAWRWLSGSPMTGRPRKTGATFLHGAVAPALPPLRFGVRLHWPYWPGYQRAAVRWVLTALAVGGWLAPILTAAIVTVALGATVTAAVVARRRVAALRGVIRVKAQVLTRDGQPIQAVAASASIIDAPSWSPTGERVAR
jgi:hypothetical protein